MKLLDALMHPSTMTRRMFSSPRSARVMMSIWPPLLGSGIRIAHINPDWSGGRVELHLNPLNNNMHGAAFGGTLFSMTDVLFGTLVARRMGAEVEVWTRTGTFQYIAPGRDGAYLNVEVSDELIAWIRATIKQDGYANVAYTSVLKNADGTTAGIGQQDLHVRPRGGRFRAENPKQAETPRGLVLEGLATAVVWRSFRTHTAILTSLMSEQRRIPSPEEQLRHVCRVAQEKSDTTHEDLRQMGVPEEYLS